MKVIDWDAQPLGRASDTVIATRLGVSPKVVATRRRQRGIPAFRDPSYAAIDWDTEPLGKFTDPVIAQRLGVSHSLVWKVRNARRIPPARPENGRLDIDWRRQPLGKVPDALLAWLLRVDVATVKMRRFRRRIRPPPLPGCPHCASPLWLRIRDDVPFLDRAPPGARRR